MYGYAYLTTNRTNGKVYVGQRRGVFNDSYFGSGILIKRALNRYGRDNFVVDHIQDCDSRPWLDKIERDLISMYRRCIGGEGMYNISDGGTGGDNLRNNPNRDSIYQEISRKLTGRKTSYSYWTGKHHSEESNKKRSEKLKGRVLSPEHIARKSKAQIGNQYAVGKKWTEASRAKLSSWRTGTKLVGGKFVKVS